MWIHHCTDEKTKGQKCRNLSKVMQLVSDGAEFRCQQLASKVHVLDHFPRALTVPEIPGASPRPAIRQAHLCLTPRWDNLRLRQGTHHRRKVPACRKV